MDLEQALCKAISLRDTISNNILYHYTSHGEILTSQIGAPILAGAYVPR